MAKGIRLAKEKTAIECLATELCVQIPSTHSSVTSLDIYVGYTQDVHRLYSLLGSGVLVVLMVRKGVDTFGPLLAPVPRAPAGVALPALSSHPRKRRYRHWAARACDNTVTPTLAHLRLHSGRCSSRVRLLGPSLGRLLCVLRWLRHRALFLCRCSWSSDLFNKGRLLGGSCSMLVTLPACRPCNPPTMPWSALTHRWRGRVRLQFVSRVQLGGRRL